MLKPAGAYAAMQKAYAMAGLTPADVNVAEIHDCFTVMGAIGTEVIGKAPMGQGAKYWVDGKAGVDGECGINTSGGLIAKGHPVGATGVAMIGWSAWQLLGKVPPELQVKNAKVAATFNIGGPICASVSLQNSRLAARMWKPTSSTPIRVRSPRPEGTLPSFHPRPIPSGRTSSHPRRAASAVSAPLVSASIPAPVPPRP